jgi:hypothetical protein
VAVRGPAWGWWDVPGCYRAEFVDAQDGGLGGRRRVERDDASCGENVINGNNGYGNGHFDAFSVIVGHEYAEVETDMHTASDQYA